LVTESDDAECFFAHEWTAGPTRECNGPT
jgi:hypothetical protein